jgi:hypothetical protein
MIGLWTLAHQGNIKVTDANRRNCASVPGRSIESRSFLGNRQLQTKIRKTSAYWRRRSEKSRFVPLPTFLSCEDRPFVACNYERGIELGRQSTPPTRNTEYTQKRPETAAKHSTTCDDRDLANKAGDWPGYRGLHADHLFRVSSNSYPMRKPCALSMRDRSVVGT